MKLRALAAACVTLLSLGACDGLVGDPAPAPAVRVAPLRPAPTAPVVPTPPATPAPVDEDGNCLTDADCPEDNPHCCQTGGYKYCQESACDSALVIHTPAR